MKKGFLSDIKNSFLIRYNKKKVKNLIKEAKKQLIRGRINQAKQKCQQAYKLYYQLLSIPIEEQTAILFRLRKVEDQIEEAEKSRAQREIEELAKDLKKLKSERDVYVIFEKSLLHKKLDELVAYIKELQKQNLFSLKIGKSHLSSKLQELSHATKKIEEEKGQKIQPKEKDFIKKIQTIEETHKTQEEEKLKQQEKELFNQIHGLLESKEKKILKKRSLFKQKAKPATPPMPPITPVHKEKVLERSKELFKYLEEKEKQGLYKPKSKGESFLRKLKEATSEIEKKEVKQLKAPEAKFLHMVSTLHKTEPAKVLFQKKPFEKEEEKKLRFLEHMKDSGMVDVNKRMMAQEKEKLETDSKLVLPKPKKRSTKKFKSLSQEEKEISSKLTSIEKGTDKSFIKRIHKKPSAQQILKEKPVKKPRSTKSKEITNLEKEETKLLDKMRRIHEEEY